MSPRPTDAVLTQLLDELAAAEDRARDPEPGEEGACKILECRECRPSKCRTVPE